jgi:hypothetical protein
MNAWGALVDISGMVTLAIMFLGLLGGTAYLVQAYNWSPWWFVLSVLLASSIRIKTDTKVEPKCSHDESKTEVLR